MNQEGTIAIITTGLLPVSSVMGGAVENLVQNFIDENENEPFEGYCQCHIRQSSRGILDGITHR